MKGVKILTWNCRGVNNTKHEIINHINNYDIIVLIELKRHNKKNCLYFPGFKTVMEQNQENNGGIAIIVRNNLEMEIVNNISNIHGKIEVIGIRIMNTTVKFNLIAIYKKPNVTLNVRQWIQGMEIDNHVTNTIVTGDFNAHNTMWNCTNTDKSGEALLEAMSNKGLICLNMNTTSREGYIGQNSSNIDLTESK